MHGTTTKTKILVVLTHLCTIKCNWILYSIFLQEAHLMAQKTS